MLSWLGSGISAEVYKARSSRDGSLYAVKKSKNELRSERERYERVAACSNELLIVWDYEG